LNSIPNCNPNLYAFCYQYYPDAEEKYRSSYHIIRYPIAAFYEGCAQYINEIGILTSVALLQNLLWIGEEPGIVVFKEKISKKTTDAIGVINIDYEY
jgi:hypothetical protein